MCITIVVIATVMSKGWEDKCEVVGQGSFASWNSCQLNTSCRWCSRKTGRPQRDWCHNACGVACVSLMSEPALISSIFFLFRHEHIHGNCIITLVCHFRWWKRNCILGKLPKEITMGKLHSRSAGTERNQIFAPFLLVWFA